jgi:hypothetical protein
VSCGILFKLFASRPLGWSTRRIRNGSASITARLPMHHTLIGLLALVSFTATVSSAQTLQSFQELALRVNLDDELRVQDRSGVTVTGRLTRVTRDAITIVSDAGEKRFARDTVRAVDVRAHPIGKSAVIGAAAFAVLGAVATAVHNGRGNTLGAAAVGAGVGAAVGSVVPSWRTIFRISDRDIPALREQDTPSAEPDLFDALGPFINLDDRVGIETQSGVRTTGRLTHLATDRIAIQTDAGEKEFTSDVLREVAVRRSPVRLMTLIGAGAGVAAGALSECRGAPHSECPDGIVLLGGLGAGVGAITGALIQRTTAVYAQPRRVSVVTPVIRRDAVGVHAAVYW